MHVNIKLETIFKCLAGAVIPLAIWLIDLNSQVTELSSTVRRLESTHTPKIAEISRHQGSLISTVSQVQEDVQDAKSSISRLDTQVQDNAGTIREIRVSLRYIEEGIQVIKTRIIGPPTTP